MTHAAHRLSPVELDALTARLANRPLPPDHPPRAGVVSLDTHRGQPLGLAILDDEPERDLTSYGGDLHHGPVVNLGDMDRAPPRRTRAP